MRFLNFVVAKRMSEEVRNISGIINLLVDESADKLNGIFRVLREYYKQVFGRIHATYIACHKLVGIFEVFRTMISKARMLY